jgi:hypothetical protein
VDARTLKPSSRMTLLLVTHRRLVFDFVPFMCQLINISRSRLCKPAFSLFHCSNPCDALDLPFVPTRHLLRRDGVSCLPR